MGKIVSPAGEMNFEVKGFERDGENLVVLAKMGVWDARVSLPFKDILRLFVMNLPLATYMLIMLPVYLLSGLFRQGKGSHK